MSQIESILDVILKILISILSQYRGKETSLVWVEFGIYFLSLLLRSGSNFDRTDWDMERRSAVPIVPRWRTASFTAAWAMMTSPAGCGIPHKVAVSTLLLPPSDRRRLASTSSLHMQITCSIVSSAPQSLQSGLCVFPIL